MDGSTRVTRLIVLEGLDGAGTTTQAKRLVEHLRTRGGKAHLTREPSDGPIGRLIREMLTGEHAIPGQPIAQSTFGLLFAADRLDHLQREVEPQLAAGATVVSDRWYHSSLAYQGTGADRDWIDDAQRARPPAGPDDLPRGPPRGRRPAPGRRRPRPGAVRGHPHAGGGRGRLPGRRSPS